MIDITPLVGIGLFIAGIIVGMIITMMYVDSQTTDNSNLSNCKSGGSDKS